MFHHSDEPARFGAGLALLIWLLGLSTSALAAEEQDALSRPEFDREVTIKANDLDIVKIYGILARLSGVPFIIEFDSDPSLKVTINATNMVTRGVLASLASTYQLEYSATDEGIVVRRRGAPPSAKRTTLGAWPPRPGPAYELEFEVRAPRQPQHGRLKLRAQTGVVSVLKVGLEGDSEVMILDRKRSIGEREYIAGLELAICVKRDTGDGLELLMELTSRQVRNETRYVEIHDFAARTATINDGKTVLFKTDTGHEIILDGWNRLSDSAARDD